MSTGIYSCISFQNYSKIYRDSIKALKDGEDAKRKTYTALCVISKDAATDTVVDKLMKLDKMGEIKLSQRTPIRVLHRRYVYHYIHNLNKPCKFNLVIVRFELDLSNILLISGLIRPEPAACIT